MGFWNEQLAIIMEIDRSTYLLIAFFCGWAAYFVRARLLNAATLTFLYPLFCLLAFAFYAAFVSLELFSPKRIADWIMYSVFAAAGGCTLGIGLLSLARRIQEQVIERAHQHRMKAKDTERERERAELAASLTAAETAQQHAGASPSTGPAPARA
jgi:hypothetical protein